MTVPSVVIVIDFESVVPRVRTIARTEEELVRMADWLERRSELLDLVDRALAIGREAAA